MNGDPSTSQEIQTPRSNTEVLIASNDLAITGLATALRAEGIDARVVTTYGEAQRFAERGTRFVAVLDADLPQDVAFQIYKLLHGPQPVPTLVLVPPGGYQMFALDPHRATLDEYVSKPVRLDELALRIRAIMLRAGYPLPASPSAAVPVTMGRPPGPDSLDSMHQGKIVAVFSTKGGVGKSTVAVNLAVGLARFYDVKVLLTDADLWFGDLGVLLNIASNKSLFDAWTGDELDLLRLSKVPVAHESGIAVLLRPPDPSMAEKLDAGIVVRAITTFTALYDYIIVDTHSSLDELTLQVLDVADQVLIVTTPEISAGHNTARFLKIADAVGYTDKIALVLNRANSGVRVESLEQQLEMKVGATLVSAGRIVVEAANRGVPVLLADPKEEEEITRNLVRVVELVAGEGRPQGMGNRKPAGSLLRGRGSGLAFWRGGGR